jgi:CHAP domain
MRRTVLYSGFIGRLVVMTVSASLAIVILSATAFAQGNASQDQYTNEPTQSDPSTAPATETPGPESTASASPDASKKSPTPDSTAPATDPPTSEPTTAPATETPAPDSTAPGTETPAPDTTAPSAPNASQECPWEPIQPGEIQGFSGCPWHRELPGGSQDLGNGQCYDTHLGVTYSCSGESQTPNPGGPGGQTPNPGHPGIQTPNPLDPGIQTPNPGSAGGSNSGGSNIIRQIETFLGSILTGGNLQKQGPHDQQKYGSIIPFIDLLNPMNVGLITGVVDLLNPIIGALQGNSPKIDKTGGLLTGIADLLRPIFGAGQGESAKIDETGQNKGDKVEPVGRGPVDANYCKQFPSDSRCRGGEQKPPTTEKEQTPPTTKNVDANYCRQFPNDSRCRGGEQKEPTTKKEQTPPTTKPDSTISTKYDEFERTWNEQEVECSDADNRNQCVDVSCEWVAALGYPFETTIRQGKAHQIFTTPKSETDEYFDRIDLEATPGVVPQKGDLVVWEASFNGSPSDGAGHVGIATGRPTGDPNTFEVLQQNDPPGSPAHLTIYSYNHVLGWLRPKPKV